jgi:hypothetical protein
VPSIAELLQTLVPIALGLGLAAACGLRVFVPLLALSLAAATGHVPLAPGWEWLASRGALVALGTATVLEVAAYMIPWLDHALDVVATPAAMIAGAIASASVMVDLPPLVKWTVVIVGGGGIAGLTQGATVLARLKSGLFTGGMANPVVALLELGGAAALSMLALAAPVAAFVVVAGLLFVLFRRAGRLIFGRGSGDRGNGAHDARPTA